MAPLSWHLGPLDPGRREPLYRQLADALIAHIRRYDIVPDTLLPSETAFMQRFAVSRMTVRQAIARLAADGWVKTIQGKGSFTTRPLPRIPNPAWRIAAANAWLEPSRMETVFLDAMVYPSTYQYRHLFGLGEHESTYRVRWLKRLEGQVVGIETRHFPPDVAAIFGADLHGGEHEVVLGKTDKTLPLRVVVTVRLCVPADFESACIGLSPESSGLSVQSTHHNRQDKPVMTGQVLYRPDLFVLEYNAFYEG